MDPVQELAWQVRGLTSWDDCLGVTADMLLAVFPAMGAGWISFDAATRKVAYANYPTDYPSITGDVLLQVYADHPLVCSYLRSSTNDTGIRRISDLVSDLELKRTRTYQEAFRPLGVDRQFSMLTARPGPASMRGWGLARSGMDFSDDELDTARRIQPMLSLLDRACNRPGEPQLLGEQFSLTTRELEVLQLLDKGLTIAAIGHLLGISPRTVAKHLEHTYAKMGCTNRIDALRRIRADG